MIPKYEYWKDMPEVLEDNWQEHLDYFHKIISLCEKGDISTLSEIDHVCLKRWLVGVDILKRISKRYDIQSYLIVSDLRDKLDNKFRYIDIGQPIIDAFFAYHLWKYKFVLNPAIKKEIM